MFCLPDYVSLVDIENDFRSIGTTFWLEKNPIPSELTTAEEKRQWRGKHEAENFENYTAQLFDFLVECNCLHLCSPTGIILRVASTVLSTEEPENFIDFGGFWLINKNTWMINPKRAEKWLEEALAQIQNDRETIDKMEEPEKSKSLEMDRLFLYSATVRKVRFLLESYGAFAGHALVLPAENAPNKVDIRKLYEGSSGSQIIRPGRPNLRHEVKSAYSIIYPDGHFGIGWKSVEKSVSAELGFSVSTDTIRRALGLRKN